MNKNKQIFKIHGGGVFGSTSGSDTTDEGTNFTQYYDRNDYVIDPFCLQYRSQIQKRCPRKRQVMRHAKSSL